MAEEIPLFPVNEKLSIEVNYQYPANGVVRTGDGQEYRNAPHAYPLAQFRFRRDLLNSRATADTLQPIRDFLNQLKGKAGKFRYRDPCDHEATAEPLTIHKQPNGQINSLKDDSQPIIAKTQGVLLPKPDGSRTEFQLFKRYFVGEGSKVTIHDRIITRPAIGDYTIRTEDGEITESLDVIVYESSTETNPTVDPTTGRVTFDTAPEANSGDVAGNYNLTDENGNNLIDENENNIVSDETFSTTNMTWEGVFDVPCQLGSDTFDFSVERFDLKTDNWIYNLEQLEIKEVREDGRDAPTDEIISPRFEFDPSIDVKFAVDTTYQSQKGQQYSTLETRSSSEKRITQSQYSEGIPQYELGSQTNLNIRQKEFLIALWRNCLGNISSFLRFEPTYLEDSSESTNRRVRFSSDSLSLEYVAENNTPFKLTSLSASEFKTPSVDSSGSVFSEPYTTNARCILIKRKDGKNIGVTNASFPFVRNNVVYEPEAGKFTNTEKTREVESSDTSIEDNFISSDRITFDDIFLGLYDEAEVDLFVINWRESEGNIATLFSGYLASHVLEGGNKGAQQVTFNLKSWDSLTEQKWLVEVTERCGLEFGSTACGVDLTPLTDTYTIDSVTDKKQFSVSSSRDAGFFDRGKVIFDSGKLKSATEWTIYQFDGSTFTLAQELPFLPQAGDEITAIAGCDKLLNSPNGCSGYNNTENFARGLAGASYVPGSETFGGANT